METQKFHTFLSQIEKITCFLLNYSKKLLTGLDVKAQAQTQQKKFLVFEFVASYELPIDKDSLDTQIFLHCPPWGTGQPILGQNRGVFSKNEKLLFQPCYSNNCFKTLAQH